MPEWLQSDQCKPSLAPIDLNLKLQTVPNGDKEVDQRIYRNFVGSVLYLAKETRPGTVFTFNILSLNVNVSTNRHLQRGELLWRYIQGSKGLRLTDTKIASYRFRKSDAHCSGDVDYIKSTTGYYFKLNGRGAALG